MSEGKALPAYAPAISAGFCEEAALSGIQMMPDMDFMDMRPRQEQLNTKGEPIMLQLCVVPACA